VSWANSAWSVGSFFSVDNYQFSFLTSSIMLSGPWEAATQIPCLLWNTKVLYHVYKGQPGVPILCQMNPVNTQTPYFLKIHVNITLPSTTRSPKLSLPFRLSNQNFVCISSPRFVLHAPPISSSLIWPS
jgi:hypothetical protein